MYGKFQQHLQAELASIEEAGLYKRERNIASAQSAEITLEDGSKALNFCANNYLGLGQLQLTLQVGHIGIGITVTDRLAQTHTVNDGGVVQGIRDNGIIGREQGLEHAAVGIEACSIEDCVFGLEVVGDGCFEFLVRVLCTADEAY